MAKDIELMTVDEIMPHPNADRLEKIKVGFGYISIVLKGQYSVGELIAFIKPDAVIDCTKPWFTTYETYLSKNWRVKTTKIRGEWSEGIVIKFNDLKKHVQELNESMESEELAKLLGVKHYEPILINRNPTSGAVIGSLPSSLGKTDQENVQNMDPAEILGKSYLITRKLDGSSCTIIFEKRSEPDENGSIVNVSLYSRSCKLDMNVDTIYSRATKSIIDIIVSEITFDCTTNEPGPKDFYLEDGEVIVIRGEVCGKGINASKVNKDAVGDPHFTVFEMFTSPAMDLLNRREHWATLPFFENRVNNADEFILPQVPVVDIIECLTKECIDKYLNAPASNGEGVVLWEFKESYTESTNGPRYYVPTGFSFKIRSKEYDSKL